MIDYLLIALAALAVYLSPVGLLVCFVLYAAARWSRVEVLVQLAVLVGVWTDVWCNYTWFRVFGPYPWRGLEWKERTVTARTTVAARAGKRWARALAWFLNLLDPGHVKLAT